MSFDFHKVHVPLFDDMTDEEYRRLTGPQRLTQMFQMNQYVREAHTKYYMELHPYAMPSDVLLDWMVVTGIAKLVPPDLLAYHTTDTPVIVFAKPDSNIAPGLRGVTGEVPGAGQSIK